MRGPVAPPVFQTGVLASRHWSRAGPVMFSICRLGTSHHRVSPGFCLLVSRAKAGGTTEEQLPYSSVSTVYFMWTKQDFSEVYKRNLLGGKKRLGTISLPFLSPTSSNSDGPQMSPSPRSFSQYPHLPCPPGELFSFCIMSPLFICISLLSTRV